MLFEVNEDTDGVFCGVTAANSFVPEVGNQALSTKNCLCIFYTL